MSIPKIIHLVEPVHNVTSVWQNTHPDWQCIEWTVEGCYAFLKRYYPESEQTYLRLTSNAQRVHFSWYHLLHRYGGVVVEGNRVPKKKIEGLFLSLYDLYLIEDWFIASVPGTDFLQYAIETLPTLEPRWYDKYVGDRALVRSTTTVLPETAYKRHSYRVYQNYFHPLQQKGFGMMKIVGIAILLAICFQLIRIVSSKEKIELWKLRWRILFHKTSRATSVSSVSPVASPVSMSGERVASGLSSPVAMSGERVVSGLSSPVVQMSGERVSPIKSCQSGESSPCGIDSLLMPSFRTLKSLSIESLEKKLNIPAIRLPQEINNEMKRLCTLPPLDPPTPSSIAYSESSSLVITPVGV